MQEQGEAEVRISSSSVGIMLAHFQRRLGRNGSCQGQSSPITMSHPRKMGERTAVFSVETLEWVLRRMSSSARHVEKCGNRISRCLYVLEFAQKLMEVTDTTLPPKTRLPHTDVNVDK